MSATRFLIQIDRPGERLKIPDLQQVFEGTGIELDPGYGPIVVNPKLGRHVVRCTASPEAREKAETIPGVRFFADAPVKPAVQ